MAKLGVIVGSGFEQVPKGEQDGLFILNRHGEKHENGPKFIDHKANIDKLIAAGCTHVLTVGACGTLVGSFKAGDLILVKDFIDLTKQTGYYDARDAGGGFDTNHHISFTEPFDEKMHAHVAMLPEINHINGIVWHWEGHRFETRAEVRMLRKHANLVNMTICKEIEMAVEAGLKVIAVGIVTDNALNPQMKDISAIMAASKVKIGSISMSVANMLSQPNSAD